MRRKLWFGAAAAALMSIGLAPGASAQSADQPGDASTQARLNGTTDGQISPAGDTDWYRLSVETGQRYNFALVGLESEGQTLDPMLSVYDAQGNQLASNDDANGSLNSALRFVPQASGEVFVEARAFSAEATGAYRLGVSAEPVPADDAGGDASTRARANAGRTTNGNIEYEGDVDWYRFAARTGNRYQITLAGAGGDSGLGDPMLRVVDAEGNELAMSDDSEGSLNSALEFIPRGNGDVFIEASGYGGAYTGAYALNITAERLPRDAVGNSRTTGGRINFGQTLNGTLDFPSDSDWFRVRLEEGQSYRFTLDSSGDNPVGDPLIRLHDASGNEVGVDDDGGEGLNSYLEFTAPSTGNYFVEASSFTGDATGGYTLSARTGDIPADNTTDASLSADGDYREGVLSPAGDRDWYRLQLTEGQAARVGMQVTGTPDSIGDPYLVVYGPDGAEITRDDDGGDNLNSYLEVQATSAGTYYVEARGFAEDAVGRYAINVVGGEIGAGPDSAEALIGNADPRTSLIGTAGDVDWFAIELIEGRPYRFMVDGLEPDALADPMLTLYDATGAQVGADDDGGRGLSPYLYFASPTGGTYFAAVSAYDGQSTGRYQIRAVDTDVPGHAYTDEYLDANDDSRISRIEMAGDIDAYRVTLEAGVAYEIDVTRNGPNNSVDPFVAVVQEGAGLEDANADAAIVRDGGRRVASDNNGGGGSNARIRFTPEAAGDYLIQVSGFRDTTGNYEVKIVRR
ncbi:MAG: PPC domain-containing protein [Hyphomonadaceae bacterium]|nr:PPC domain-containing protein [Hyphomonadaceae bacterium]